MEEDKLIKIHLKEKIITLKLNEFKNIDTGSLLNIDYYNILGEILTFPVIMNRIGNLRADLEEMLSEAKLESKLKKAELNEHYTKELRAKQSRSPTITQIESFVFMDKVYINTKKIEFRVQKEFSYIDSLYWAAKSKDDKLTKVSEKLRPEEFEKEIVEDTINGIVLKKHNKLIK